MPAAGKVYSLSQEEIEAQEDRKAVVCQAITASILLKIIEKARREIEALDFPLNWPNKHYDRQATLDMLTDLMPDQTIREMELEAEVRRAETRTAERNGQ